MFFNYRLLFHQLFSSIFHGRNRDLRFGPKRIRFLLFFIVLFPPLWLMTQIGFLIDHLLFGGFRNQKVEQPIFILGNFRSGSTLLHRLLAQDRKNFTSIKTWEIYTAPSITQRKLLRGVRIVDSWFGAPFHKRLLAWEKRELKQVKIHTIGIYEPEEDEGLFFYIWYSLFVWFFFPAAFDRCRFDMFDQFLSEKVKERVMKFYKGCIKRHLYAHRRGRFYLTKNPSHTGKIDSLLKEFPDAHIVYLYRDPNQMISSTMSWFSFAMHYFADLPEKYPHKKIIMEMARHFYQYPPARLQQEEKNRYIMVNYSDLTGDLESVIVSLYDRFGLNMSNKFKHLVKNTAEHSKRFKSGHRHSPVRIGISENEISTYFSDN